MNNKRKACRLLFLGIIFSLLTGCGSSQNEKSETNEAVPVMVNDFLIIGFSGPPEGEVNLERYREIADAGIEILVPGNGTLNAEQNLLALDLAAKVGMKIIPVDMRILPFTLNPELALDTSVINAMVKDYQDHQAMAAYVIRDEPNADIFPTLGKITTLFHQRDPMHEPVINLFPSYGSPIQLGFEDYRSYISSFIETVNPGLLSYDNYALREGVTWYDAWFSDLKIVREETRKAGIPFIVFMQSQGIKGGMRVPNRADILWQVNTALAYGARGVGWFSYWTPQPDQGYKQEEDSTPILIEPHYNAMIDLQGERTEVYDYVKEANFYLKKAGKGLMDWDHTEVSRWEAGILEEGTPSKILHPAGENAHIVMGTYLEKDSKICRIVISNSRCDEASSFQLEPLSDWKIDHIFNSMDASANGERGDLSGWRLEAGGSVILELIQTH